jgi:signal transduction histidine kinase
MEAGGALPGRDPPVQAVVLRESETSRVTRLFLPGGPVVRKEPLGPGAERRLRHERAMLERLRGVAGVAQLVAIPGAPGSLVLADAGDTTLAGVATPLAVDELLRVGAALARAVAEMHRRGVMHRDIVPANVVVSADGTVTVVDFGLATSFAEIRLEFTHHSEVVGTLAYLAPEQTGRTGRPVDQRADLYALGATLYELATGAPPFGTGGPLRLTHDHLARVPTPPAEVNPAVPAELSAIVLRLLEKEPDHRYQSAEGVVHDLDRVRDARTRPAARRVFRVGERDVPLRLAPPSRLVGRDTEVAGLVSAFEDALAGRCRGLVVGGPPGVGKTALVDQLRPVVTGRDGWFVAGKFDPYRRDLEFNAVRQAFRALGRLLLAEPEDELAAVRARALAALGPNAGLLSATVQEFETLLAVPPDAGDPLTAQVRAQQVGVQGLRAVASRHRPVVLFVDDLQWAGRTPMGFVDLVLTDEPIDGLLLVAAYRDTDVDPAHPLAAMLARWRDHPGVRRLELGNLSAPNLVTMVAEMLHLPPATAAGLAELIGPYTRGNPYETVELLNALRGDGALTVTGTGWRWNPTAVRAHLHRADTGGLLATRVDAMPGPSRQILQAMACLGGRAELSLLQIATGHPATVVDQQLAPALDDGLLVMEPGPHEAVRFRHDRIRETILAGLGARPRRALQQAMARRLAEVPELFAVAAEQYLPVIDTVTDPGERHHVVELLRRAADQAAMIGDHALVNALLAGALELVEPGETDTLIQLHTARHAALYSFGRLDEADGVYRTVERLCPSASRRADATAMQVRSLTHRKRFAEAIDLGLESLRVFGITLPAPDELAAGLDHQFEHLYRWLEHTDTADDLVQPEITDAPLLAATRLLNAVLPAFYFVAQHAAQAWMSLEAMRIWIEHGPGPTLVGPACVASFHTAAQRGDSAAGYRALRRILAVGEARGYKPDVSDAHRVFAILSCWFEPIENGLHAAQRARDGLIAGGDLAYAGYTYHPIVYFQLDCAPTLDEFVAQVEAGLAFVRRTGSEQTGQWLDSHQWLVDVLRGEDPAATDITEPVDRYADNPLALLHAHLNEAIAAAVFGRAADLSRHTAAAMPLLPAVLGNYPTAVAHLLRGLALAGQARAADGAERAGLLSELDDQTRWLAERAADAPDNFLHLQRLLEAERAWATDGEGDFRAAALAFDAALREVTGRRPWHRALITERAARFYLAHGIERVGHDLLTQARRHYLAWGATAKVARLDRAHTTRTTQSDPAPGLAQRRPTVTTATLDLLGILSTSQALSSETSLERLHTRVVEVLSAMTGATGVRLLLWNEGRHDWQLPASHHDRALPMSVLRYARRTGEPLVVPDATRDDRFARDPYFAGLGRCSLLAVPIHSRGTLRAVLLLENRLIRDAFTTERLDAVTLIAGQLAVSLDNAQLYTELTASRARIAATADDTRRRIERDLHDGAQQRLVTLALQARHARAAVPADADELCDQLDSLATGLTSVLDELRELARGIHPAVLAEGGLHPALKGLARRSPIPVDLTVRLDRRLPEHIEVAAFYLVTEALTLVTKHAGATLARVELHTTASDTGATLHVSIADDGSGGADLTRGSGLVGLKDRVEALGGRLTVDTAAHVGTTVQAELPLGSTHTVSG